jgi:hypothetical protein
MNKGKVKRGLLLVYGGRLPEQGVVFLAPVKGNNITKVRDAMKVCVDRWPFPDKRKKYDANGIWADGSMSECDEDKDRENMLRIALWEGLRYEWDFETGGFVPMTYKKVGP